MATGIPFSPEEDAFIAANWERYVVKDIAAMMGRNEERVRQRGMKLGLKSRKLIGATVKPPPPQEPKASVVANVSAPQAWPDGWCIAAPTEAQLRAGR